MQHNECFERSKNIYHTSEAKLRVIFLRGIEQSLITQNVITGSWMTLDASQVTTKIQFFFFRICWNEKQIKGKTSISLQRIESVAIETNSCTISATL